MIAIVIASRGLIHSRVIEAIERERDSYWEQTKIFVTNDLPIPESQNTLVERALAEGASHLWFIEEDVVVPPGSLKEMLRQTEDIILCDYAVNGVSCVARDEDGGFLWGGLGCTMIKSHVFEKTPKPWFRIDKQFRLNDKTWIDVRPEKTYGGQDIWFFLNKKNRFTMRQLDGECDHLMVEEYGGTQTNRGIHLIKAREKIKNQQKILWKNDHN